MAAQKESTPHTIIVKNLPKHVQELTEQLAQLQPPAQHMKSFGRRRALLSYGSENEAAQALEQLHGLQVLGKQLNAAIFRKDEANPNAVSTGAVKCNKTTQTHRHATLNADGAGTAVAAPHIGKYVRQLYATEPRLNFEQPPPPYLKYAYPRVTPSILDAICMALMSDTRFYTQVLHLMNRMNLEPPFGPKTRKYQAPGAPKDAATQTTAEIMIVESPPVTQTVEAHKSASESELETSEDERKASKKDKKRIKRKALPQQEEEYKKKARKLLQSALKQPPIAPAKPSSAAPEPTSIPNTSLAAVFEQAHEFKAPKIALNLKTKKKTAKAAATPTFVPPSDFGAQQLTTAQLAELPLYKNYQTGASSNKLYIKNLAKEVSEADLLALYARFIGAGSDGEHLAVKVMQQGRMKGQAFVTFLSASDPYEDVARALTETNGFILRDKPMVVCYGKK